MLGYYRNHQEYVGFVLKQLFKLGDTHPEQVRYYKDTILKMLLMNLDPMRPIIEPLYSYTGRPAQMQMEIFRSLVLMKGVGEILDRWVDKLLANPVLLALAGFTPDNMPKTSSYYDFINRVFPLDDKPVLRSFKSKPRAKLKKGEKLPPKNKHIVAKLVKRFINDEERFLKQLARRPERHLQRIFARVAVDSSVDRGLIDPESVIVSGDGTPIETGASIYGRKVCNCTQLRIYKCDCPRLFSDPSANWGWDSHNERYFYGHTWYFISTHNKDDKIDLPLYTRLVQGSRHDSVSAVFALAEFRELNPNLTLNSFVSDSASDNYATYDLLHHLDINAVIALGKSNNGNFKHPPPIRIDEQGTPICPADRPMSFHGLCKGRSRIKWRCPKQLNKLSSSKPCPDCSQSSYGRVVYTKPDWDRRLFTRIPRGSHAWKLIMRQRTAAERINDRILIDYAIEHSSVRGKKRISFFVTLAAINIHLDAQLKYFNRRESDTFQAILDSSLVFNT